MRLAGSLLCFCMHLSRISTFFWASERFVERLLALQEEAPIEDFTLEIVPKVGTLTTVEVVWQPILFCDRVFTGKNRLWPFVLDIIQVTR